MSKQIEREVERYYDTHPTEEDLMGDSVIHGELIRYLVAVLQWLFRDQVCAICSNVNFYRTPDKDERPIVPDIAVIKGEPLHLVMSWYVGVTGPAPQVVLEILSPATWQSDLSDKPRRYAEMGVHEYFVYDPHLTPLEKEKPRRLRGWRLDHARGNMVELLLDAEGRLWSVELDSWLVPDGANLRLYDRYNRRRLKGEEAEAEAKRRALLRAEEERRKAEAEAGAKRMALQRAEEERRRAEALAEKLRALGVDPDRI